MEIKIDRESVCMGDDCEDHSKIYQFEDNATYEDLFEKLKNDNYFPSVSGNNVVWVLTAKDFDCIFSYYTKMDKFFAGLSEKSLMKICGSFGEVNLHYYSNPISWKEKIELMYAGNTYTMWRDGWLEELKYCDYLTALGQ